MGATVGTAGKPAVPPANKTGGKQLFIATESFTANLTSGDTHVHAGVTLVRDSDELYVRYSEKFRRAPVERPEVEQATAGPGERRAFTPRTGESPETTARG